MIKFTYHGEAVGKGRPRYTKRGDYVHTYTPKKTKDFEDAIRFEFMASNCDPMPVYDKDIALVATIKVGVEIPRSYSKKKQALCREGFVAVTKRPDLDNICKSVLDSINGGYAYADDSQVVKLIAEKVYADKPFVEVTIDELRPTE